MDETLAAGDGVPPPGAWGIADDGSSGVSESVDGRVWNEMVSEFGDPYALSASIADQIGPMKTLYKPPVPA